MGAEVRMVVSVEPTRPEDVLEMAPFIRVADRLEAKRLGITSAPEGLMQALQKSALAYTARVDGQIVCIFGVAPHCLLLDSGTPWLVGTDLIERHARQFLRHSRPYLAEILALYPRLSNFVDASNTHAVRWLRWLGFFLDGPSPVGPRGAPFYRFTMEV